MQLTSSLSLSNHGDVPATVSSIAGSAPPRPRGDKGIVLDAFAEALAELKWDVSQSHGGAALATASNGGLEDLFLFIKTIEEDNEVGEGGVGAWRERSPPAVGYCFEQLLLRQCFSYMTSSLSPSQPNQGIATSTNQAASRAATDRQGPRNWLEWCSVVFSADRSLPHNDAGAMLTPEPWEAGLHLKWCAAVEASFVCCAAVNHGAPTTDLQQQPEA